MRKYLVSPGTASASDLRLVEDETPEPGPGEILIRVRACALNFRDQMIVNGRYFQSIPYAFTPLSDGAGEVVRIGEGVTRFCEGDRVAGIFFPDWIDGSRPRNMASALGQFGSQGMLAEYVCLPEYGVVPVAASLSFEEAATLPCAGVTAWNALMEGPRVVQPGATILVLGTGGVSLFALQIAHAAGAKVIITSSSRAKLERAASLGASEMIDYCNTPEWGALAVKLSNGGVDHVVEVGGPGTLRQSVDAIAGGGEIALVGFLAGMESDANLTPLISKSATIRGLTVGNRTMAERLNAAVDACGIKPVVDRVFPFDEAVDAYAYQASKSLFGKVVITVD